jgi:hypothetical protein
MVAATVPLKFGSARSWSLCRAAGLTPPETAGSVTPVSAYRRIGVSAYRRIGVSAYRRIGSGDCPPKVKREPKEMR